MRVLAALVLILAALAAGCGGDDDEGSATGAAGDTAGFTATEGGGTTSAETTETTETGGGDGQEAGPCESVEAPEPRPDGTGSAPTEPLDPARTHDVVVTTNCGEFTIRLDPEAAPKATASFAALVEADFFDGTVFHRIVPGFVIQGGDPTATGTGGPGYSTVDTPAPRTLYTKGVVAMAKAGAEPPGTAGSQFFVVTAADAGLPPDYAVVGEVTEGLEVVDAIGMLGGPDEVPTQPVVVESMTLRTS